VGNNALPFPTDRKFENKKKAGGIREMGPQKSSTNFRANFA
jgi:hypothetical protein